MDGDFSEGSEEEQLQYCMVTVTNETKAEVRCVRVAANGIHTSRSVYAQIPETHGTLKRTCVQYNVVIDETS